MEMYLTEEERLEALKRWWKENARAVFLGVALGAAILASWNFWQRAQQQKAEQASLLFQQMIQAQTKPDGSEALGKLAIQIEQLSPDSTYGIYAKLFLIKSKVDAGDLATAHQQLQDLLNRTREPSLRQIIGIRLARVMQGEGKDEEALKWLETLNSQKGQAWTEITAELKGDLLMNLKQTEAAKTAYEQARRASNQASPLLEQKLSNLGVTPPKP